MFRDSAWDPDGRELVVHEYQMLGTADRAVGRAALRDRRATRAALRRVPRCGAERSVDGRHRAPGDAHRSSGSACATPTAAPTSTTGCAPWPRYLSSPRPCPAESASGGSTMPETAPATRAGRPRRFESDDELRILLDAALVVMERNGYVDAAVADILREADLSTRSFYRHFESKDQLLSALFRREADAAAARLRAKVDAAADPTGGAARLDRRDPQLRTSPGQGRPRQRARLARRHEGRGLCGRDAPRLGGPHRAPGGVAAGRGRPTARSRWPTPSPMRRSFSRSSGPRRDSIRPGRSRPPAPKRRARCVPSASVRWE